MFLSKIKGIAVQMCVDAQVIRSRDGYRELILNSYRRLTGRYWSIDKLLDKRYCCQYLCDKQLNININREKVQKCRFSLAKYNNSNNLTYFCNKKKDNITVFPSFPVMSLCFPPNNG